jgi:hypothetical protein
MCASAWACNCSVIWSVNTSICTINACRTRKLAGRLPRAEARKEGTTIRGEPLIPLSASEIRRLPNEQRQASVEQRPV